MNEHKIQVDKTARYFTLGDEVARPAQAWFVCHGYRQLAHRFLRRFTVLADGTRHVVAPEGLSRFYVDPGPGRHGPEHRVGASWMTREDRLSEIEDYVGYLDRLAEFTLAKVGEPDQVVLGFSQGVHTAARWVTQGAVRPHRLVLWGAHLPDDLDMTVAARRLEEVDVMLVRGLDDPTVTKAGHERQERRMADAGIAFRTLEHPGGHDMDPDLLVRIAQDRM